MYEAQLEKDWKYIITDSDAKLIISANDSIHRIVQNYIGKARVCYCMYVCVCVCVCVCVYACVRVYVWDRQRERMVCETDR